MPGIDPDPAPAIVCEVTGQRPRDDDDAPPEIVFVTAYDESAVQVFEQGAVDCVLEPAQAERLRVTVERLQRRLAARGTRPSSRRRRCRSCCTSSARTCSRHARRCGSGSRPASAR
jgi:DNA-binding LytR/AlgR family response regulator